MNRIAGTGSGLSRNSSAPAAGRPGEADHRLGDLNRLFDLFDLFDRYVLARMSEIFRWRLCDYTAWTKKGLDGSI